MKAIDFTKPYIVVIVGHGSRDPKGAHAFIAFAEKFAISYPQYTVRWGFMELAAPAIGDVLESAAAEAPQLIVVPLSLLTAGHVKNELPILVSKLQTKHPELNVHLTPALGVHPLLISAAVQSVLALEPALSNEAEASASALVVVGRGASDPDANSDFFKVARLLAEGMGIKQVIPCFSGITHPNVAEALETVTRLRPRRVIVVPYLLFTGVLQQRLEASLSEFQQRQPWTKMLVLPQLIGAADLGKVVAERVAAASNGGDPLPCVSCKYRTPIGKISNEVGGMRALLWSLRHSLTHSQATPHVHAHKPLKKHVLVCTNQECAARGSIAVLQGLRRAVKAASLNREVQVTRTSCLARCGEGPTVVVYPDGVWYRGFSADDAEPLVTEHLSHDRLLSHRVDSIL